MIDEIVKKPIPRKQCGKITHFKRRTPEQSRITKGVNIDDLIRMVDGNGYPKAFIESAGFRFEFTDIKKGIAKCAISRLSTSKKS